MSPIGPMRDVVRWWSPDPRHPFLKDLKLSCGHTLAHRKMIKGADGRFHVPKRQRCTCCSEDAPDSKPRHRMSQRIAAIPSPAASIEPKQAGAASSVEAAVPIWSPRDLAARNFD